MDQPEPILLLAVAIGLSFFIVRKYRASTQIVRDYVRNHYENKKMTVVRIGLLNFTEHLKYGMPPFSFYIVYLPFFNLKINYSRKIELSDNSGNTFLKYVDLDVYKGEVTAFKEFESYDL